MSCKKPLYADERRASILAVLDRSASVQVSGLARAFSVSAVTIRGDLDALERAGKLRRTHGGAVSLHRSLTVSIQDRRVNVNVEAKRRIAQASLSLISDGDALLVDSGTTALEFVRMLGVYQSLTVITADVTIADLIDESMPSVDVMLLGGALRQGHRYLTGPLVLRSLEVLHPDKAVICPTSYVPGRGLMTGYAQMAEVKAAFLAAADECIVLMDATKIGSSGLMRFGGLEDVDAVVVDADPDGLIEADIRTAMETSASRCRLLIADATS
ncbi:transcriptional regulator, DeoR family [Coriobacterium glomerans PW2]|uniref:Transcriptional regulator, DeoR family n=1 Tax=Coriobacterium glomerans (strain ATCC 49209 / DSM 20642 / JCM 10262 / PW2) TaxID=700015 RepID=F2NAK9_CORGP|nr:DeoR/GlpR family DNA-binding transcription regulator [Coriobacterium glomerans]AEB06536.1 transcriptional regulator, DeoR family [Coriobacterium glomerans PW2]